MWYVTDRGEQSSVKTEKKTARNPKPEPQNRFKPNLMDFVGFRFWVRKPKPDRTAPNLNSFGMMYSTARNDAMLLSVDLSFIYPSVLSQELVYLAVSSVYLTSSVCEFAAVLIAIMS